MMNNNNTTTLIFLGPTLPKETALKLLPTAKILPPVQCGDVLAALRLKPKTIAIIDGCFHNTAAVWHKEILMALESDVQVFGASSMGALRAAELTDFGMIGIGKIYQDFHQGILNDDDEVAILHSPAHFDYSALTDAMVNIRATVNAALNKKIINETSAAHLLEQAKSLYYQQRTLGKACELAIKAGANAEHIHAFWQWSSQGGYVEQKQQDAIELLQRLANNSNQVSSSKTFKMNHTKLITSLMLQTSCDAFPSEHDWLPETEKTILKAKQSSPEFLLLCKLAKAFAICYQMALTENIKPNPNSFSELDITINTQAHDNNTPPKNLNAQTPETFQCLQLIATLLASAKLNRADIQKKITYLQKLSGAAQQLTVKPDNTLKWLATIWQYLETQIADKQLKINPDYCQVYSDNFRQQHQLLSSVDMQQWLEKNDFTLESYQEFITHLAQFDVILSNYNLDVLNIIPPFTDNHWLYDCIELISSSMRLQALYSTNHLV